MAPKKGNKFIQHYIHVELKFARQIRLIYKKWKDLDERCLKCMFYVDSDIAFENKLINAGHQNLGRFIQLSFIYCD